MIKFIIRTILILLILYLLAPIVFAITPQQKDNLFMEAKLLCGIYSKVCNVIEVKDNEWMWANTNYKNEIKISTALLNKMNEEQVRGVLYHEVGHVVHSHIGRTATYVARCGKQCDSNDIAKLRRTYEYQSDKFATLVSKYTGIKTDLIGALLILTPKENIYKEYPTHPSTANRIERMRRIMYE